MKLIILGSGTCVPSLRRNAPGCYLETGQVKALVDCGSGTLRQLERAGRSYREIDAVFLTHTHPDHVADLLPLIHALLATPAFERKKDLYIHGPAGITAYYEKHISPLLRKPDTFQAVIIEAGGKEGLADLNIITTPAVHSRESMAYRFEASGSSIVITGDSEYDEGLVQLSQTANLLIADCSFPESLKAPGHMTPRECALIAKRAGVKKLVLTHIYPTGQPDEIRLEEAAAVFDGEIILAEDLMEFDL